MLHSLMTGYETDNNYGRRSARQLALTKRTLKQANLDRVILTRQYDYIGHVMRYANRNPICLLRHVLVESATPAQGATVKLGVPARRLFLISKIALGDCARTKETWQHKNG